MSQTLLLELAKEAVRELFSDRSVPASETRESLREIAADIEAMLDSLPEKTDDGGEDDQ